MFVFSLVLILVFLAGEVKIYVHNCTNLLHSDFCLGWPVVFSPVKKFST